MSEIKHTFQAGKMNKDLDERLVPNGEYRDALNIEVRTSDGGDAGTVQNLSGTIERLSASEFGNINPTVSWDGVSSTTVGSIGDGKTNKAYFLIASPPIGEYSYSTINGTKLYKDMVVQYDTITKTVSPVIVDMFEVHCTNTTFSGTLVSGAASIPNVDSGIIKLLKPGMRAELLGSDGALIMNDEIRRIDTTTNEIFFFSGVVEAIGTGVSWVFTAPRTLNLGSSSSSYGNLITGLNIINNLLLWVDNKSEPKKINIDRCIAGSTGGFDVNTKLMINNTTSVGSLVEVGVIDQGIFGDLKEEHITTIRRSPRSAPYLLMETSTNGITGSFTYNGTFVTSDGPMVSGDILQDIALITSSSTDSYGVGVDLVFTSEVGEEVVRCQVLSVSDSGDHYELEIISISTNVLATHDIWTVKESKSAPLFELKLGRFSYRYKYQDGEFSTFAPWSGLAFLPGEFDFKPSKGYNLGMVNQLQLLSVNGFIAKDTFRPSDVVGVDILYKDTSSTIVYLVKSISNKDGEWHKNRLDITSEMVHMAIPSSQILRAWDNVPRVAKAQEVTGNRVVYGNYLQNHTIIPPIVLNQVPKRFQHPPNEMPLPSVKSMRKYKVGVVFGDKYGRETPVMGIGGVVGKTTMTADITINKDACASVNKLTVGQKYDGESSLGYPISWAPPTNMEYFKYYVKETTNEYYNLALDRWYNADDGNVWLSFPSADRNKIDEDTYLILKNIHGSQEPVLGDATYKVMAIENEAPTFIKTVERVLGSASLVGVIPLADQPTLTLVDFSDSAAIWNNSLKGIKFSGIGYARIRSTIGETLRFSEWIAIARFSEENKQVSIGKVFGDTADLTQMFAGTGLDTDIAISWLEVKDDVVESKPEFDGRFFVKIEKDTALEENVLMQTSDAVTYNSTKSFKFAYLEDEWENPGVGPTSGTNVAGVNLAGDYINHTFSSSHFNEGNLWKFGDECTPITLNNKHFWQDWTVYPTIAQGCLWFLDGATNFAGSPAKGLHGALSGVSGKSGMHFSKQYAGYPASGTNSEFRSLLTTPGTLFKFEDDPNKVVYRVHSGGPEWQQVNYGKTNFWGACMQSDTATSRRETFTCRFTSKDNISEGLDTSEFDPRDWAQHDGKTAMKIVIVKPYYANAEKEHFTENGAMWETEPKEDVGLDLYYEASSSIPIKLDNDNNHSFAPLESRVDVYREGVGVVSIANDAVVNSMVRDIVGVRDSTSVDVYPFQISEGDIIRFTHVDGTITQSKVLDYWNIFNDDEDTYAKSSTVTLTSAWSNDDTLTVGGLAGSDVSVGWSVKSHYAGVTVPPNTFITNITSNTATLNNAIQGAGTNSFVFTENTGYYRIDRNVYKYKTQLPWYNCYSFGNGVESDRIRDDYNAPQIDNGVKVSTILVDYKEERRGSGLIHSGIYNSTSGVNNLNEFNMAESITKDLNPSYGFIQALKSRDTNLVTFCEDKVLKILANKDALFNADGSTNITASSAVLGDASGFSGDYGISLNPESLAFDGYRMYFTDMQRDKVMRLSQDGLTPISDIGMKSWFRDNLSKANSLIGSFDTVKGEYNLTLGYKPLYISPGFGAAMTYTDNPASISVSFSEATKGWVSFKSFALESGLSINSEYITSVKGKLWSHHDESLDSLGALVTPCNKLYGVQEKSSIDIMFNDNPGSVKSFAAMNYEGSQAKVNQFTTVTIDNVTYNDGEYYNLNAKDGWYVSNFDTDMHHGKVPGFVNKEGKWFNNILGYDHDLKSLDTSQFSVQGLGFLKVASTTTQPDPQFTITLINVE